MKISLSTYSFNSLMQKGEMTLLDAPSKARELGFSAIEICLNETFEKEGEEYAKKLRRVCEENSVSVSTLVFGADLLSGTKASDNDPKKEIERVKRIIDLAKILGAPIIRHDAFFSLGACPSFDKALCEVAPRIREISAYAKERGIKTTVENHGQICQDPDRMEKLYNAVDFDNFGILTDIGNFLCADCDPVTSVSRVAKYTSYVHAKDFYFKSGSSIDKPGRGFFATRSANYLKGAPIGHGIVPVTQCLKILKAHGYDGFVTLEYEGAEDCIRGIEIGKENLESYIASIQ